MWIPVSFVLSCDRIEYGRGRSHRLSQIHRCLHHHDLRLNQLWLLIYSIWHHHYLGLNHLWLLVCGIRHHIEILSLLRHKYCSFRIFQLSLPLLNFLEGFLNRGNFFFHIFLAVINECFLQA